MIADQIGEDEPVLLSRAPSIFFPHGGVSVSTLRTEMRKGNLVTERIGGKDFVTAKAIKDMRSRCQGHGSRPASISEQKVESASGSSETGSGIDAQTALRNRLSRPSRPSQTTSPTASGPTRRNVVHLRSTSEPS